MPKQNRKTSSRATKSIAAKKSERASIRRHRSTAARGSRSRDVQQLEEPKSPMPAQHQEKPGLESKMKPRPRYLAPHYRGADKLAGKVALITGGDSGIGRAVAVLFAREGADVAFTYLPEEESDAKETQAAIEAEGRRALRIKGDLTNAKFASTAVETTIKNFDQLDILVNNAAYQKSQDGLGEITDEQLERTFKTNIFGYFYMARAALPHLKKGSTIINTGSITGLDGSKHLLDYSATKGAIHAWTKSLAQNLIKKGIRVNCVAPGPVWTPLNPADKPAKEVAEFGADTPMERPAQPKEIAPASAYSASDA